MRVAGGRGAREDLDRARQRRERVADLVGDVGGHSAQRRETVRLAHPGLHRADRRQVVARADQPEPGALAGAERGESKPHGDRGPVRSAEQRLVPGGRARVALNRRFDLEQRHGVAEGRRPRSTDRLAGRASRDLLGGPVERGDPVVAVKGDQARAHGLEDEVLERLQVGQILPLGLELLARRPELLRQAAGDDRNGQEGPGVEEHGQELQGGGLLRRVEEHIGREHGAGEDDPGVEHARHARHRQTAGARQEHARAGDRQHVEEAEDGPPAARRGHDGRDEHDVEQAEQPCDGTRLHAGAEEEQDARGDGGDEQREREDDRVLARDDEDGWHDGPE